MARRVRQLDEPLSKRQGETRQRREAKSSVLFWRGISNQSCWTALAEWGNMLTRAREVDEFAFDVLVGDLREFVDGTDRGGRGHGAAVTDVSHAVCAAGKLALRSLCLGSSGREKFTLLKSVYQDAFEVAHRNLALIARVSNLAYRGDARVHVDGLHFSLRQAARHTTAGQRERWLAEYPKAGRVYRGMSRKRRNAIGHNKLHYDKGSKTLLYEDGSSEPYENFLKVILELPVLTTYLHSITTSLTSIPLTPFEITHPLASLRPAQFP